MVMQARFLCRDWQSSLALAIIGRLRCLQKITYLWNVAGSSQQCCCDTWRHCGHKLCCQCRRSRRRQHRWERVQQCGHKHTSEYFFDNRASAEAVSISVNTIEYCNNQTYFASLTFRLDLGFQMDSIGTVSLQYVGVARL